MIKKICYFCKNIFKNAKDKLQENSYERAYNKEYIAIGVDQGSILNFPSKDYSDSWFEFRGDDDNYDEHQKYSFVKSINFLIKLYTITKEFPEEITGLKALRELCLGGNKFRKFPESFGNLKNLQTLLLFDNNLTELTESIGRLANPILIEDLKKENYLLVISF